jgi:pimeloyl-ACP methyl ester carboxylesterase
MRINSKLIGLCAALIAMAPLHAATATQQGRAKANGITIAYEIYGPADREAILLIAGTAMQLTDWPVPLIDELVKKGYRVVIYDNRDIGLSTKFEAAASRTWPLSHRLPLPASQRRCPTPFTTWVRTQWASSTH